jgi:signal transduction histidine kinase
MIVAITHKSAALGNRLILHPFFLPALVMTFILFPMEGLAKGSNAAVESPVSSRQIGTVTNLAQVRRWLWAPSETSLPVDLEGVVGGIFPELSLVVLLDDTGNAGIKLDLERFPFLKVRQRIRITGLAQFGKGEASLLPMRLIDDDGLHAAQEASGRLYLTAGMHPFSLRYFQFVRERVLKVEYKGPDASRRKLPPEALFRIASPGAEEMRCEPGLTFDYYEGIWHGVPDFLQLEPVKSGIAGDINLNVRLRNDYFALRFNGLLKIEKPGEYVFYLTSDDGSQLFLQDIPTSAKVLSENGAGQTNAPQPLDIGQPLAEDSDYLWSVVEGTVTFIGHTAKGCNLEISSGGAQMNVYLNSSASLAGGLVNDCRICATGYCQAVVNEQGRRVLGSLLVPETNDISLLAAESGQSSSRGGASEPLPVLTTAEQIRQLKPKEAARAHPVRLRGIITAREVLPEGIIQDLSSAVYVRFHVPESQQPSVGSYCELTGVTGPGGFATLVIANQIADLGVGQYPPPLHPDYSQLLDGSMDCQWVEVQGMVARLGTQGPEVHLAVKGGEITALILANGNPRFIDGLSNAFVRIRGCVIPGRNESGQMTKQVYLWVPALSCIAMVQAPLADPFQAPLKQVSELSLFDSHPNYYQMTKVSGQVLHVADQMVYFSDGTNCLRIIPKSLPPLVAGDLIEAVGLAELSAASPLLIEALIRKIGHAGLPAPPLVSFEQMSQPEYDAHRVRMEARLTGIRTEMNRVVLELQSGLRNLRAIGPTNLLTTPTPPLESRVSVCGVVAQAHKGDAGNPGSAELELNSPADITCLQLPPFWTPRRAFLIIEVLTAAVLLTSLWIHFLRRTVAKRTQALRLEMNERQLAEEKVRALQTERALEAQRARIARNIHDDLGARVTKLTRLAGQITVSEADSQERLNEIASTSRQMVEALDRTVWAVNPANDTLPKLANYVTHFAEEFFHNTNIRCQLDISLDLPELPVTAEFRFNLLLVVKEAFNNILKHADAQTVSLNLLYLPGRLELTIRDDGRGFEPDSVTRRSGQANLKKRVEELGGQITVGSSPGAGTGIFVTVPLPAPAAKLAK